MSPEERSGHIKQIAQEKIDENAKKEESKRMRK